jgi:beta-lactamase class A
MSISSQTALERLFTSPEINQDWFAPTFLQHIPVSIEQVIADLKKSLGAYQRVTWKEERYLVVFEKGKVPTLIALNSEGQITGLLFQEILSSAIALDEIIKQLQSLPGQVHFLVKEGRTELASLNADQPLAVGSAFKLAVLAALRQQIDERGSGRSWADVVSLQPGDKSLPSGILQTWFDGALLTVQSLATLMISRSDNTATDALIRFVGRDRIESLTYRNRPFLTTREFFTLKNPQHQALLEHYREGNESERRRVLQSVATLPLPNASIFEASQVLARDVEWFFTPRELCQLMERVVDLPLMSVNPGGGILDTSDWSRVAFKGGSEVGVLNLTTWLQAKNGKTYCVCVTWNNDQPLDETHLLTLYSAAIAGLKERVV